MAAIQSREETRGNENCTNDLERSADSPAQTSITPARREHRYKNLLHLWEFLLELLADENCRSIICWRRKEHGEFRIMNQHEVARRWGMLKQRGGMNYGKLSRALRLYYREGIITKVICGRDYVNVLERFSFECRKTKTKVIILTNHNSRKQSNELIRARSKYTSPVPSAPGKTRASKSRLVLVLLLIGRRSGARVFNQPQSVANTKPNCGITFDTQLKSALTHAKS